MSNMEKSIASDILRLLKRLESADYSDDVRDHDNGKNGYVECVNGILRVKNPEEGGQYASLVSTKQVEIRVNGDVAHYPLSVQESDRIEVAISQAKAYELTISEDFMRVYLHLFSEKMVDVILKDSQPAFEYVPQTEHVPIEDRKRIREEILQELQTMGVVSPIDEVALHEALGAPYSTAVVVSTGQAMQLGHDGYIEMMFPNATEQVITDWRRKVDYRDHGLIPSVASGDTIGIIHKAVAGQPGVDVFGHEVAPSPVSDVTVKLMSNVRMDEAGRVIALKAGRPSLTGEHVKTFDIQTVHIVPGDVDLNAGNVLFNGDVLIQGNVLEGMSVEATGNITVLGNVYSATLVSSQNVYVHGHVTKGKVYGGKIGLLYSKVYDLIDNIMQMYLKLESDAKAAHEMAQQKNIKVTIGQIVSLLIEKHLPGLYGLLSTFSELITGAGAMIPVEFKLVERLLQLFAKKELLVQINQWNDIRKVYDYLLLIKKQIEDSVCDESDIVVSFANLSDLETNGSLVVTGHGLLNCQVATNKNCLFTDENSSIKGGHVTVKGRIHAFEAGSGFGRKTYLQVGESIKLKKAEGLIIKVGSRVIQIDEERHNLFFSLDKQGNLHQEQNRHRERRG